MSNHPAARCPNCFRPVAYAGHPTHAIGDNQFLCRPDLRCPDWPGDDEGLLGCGSTNISWDGDVWDCLDCGLFFTTKAATPPSNE